LLDKVGTTGNTKNIPILEALDEIPDIPPEDIEKKLLKK